MSKTTDPQLRNFHQWIRAPIRKLLSTRQAGFALAMIAFPVLERWTRGKVRIGSSSLRGTAHDRFCAELAVQFQSLRDPADGSFPHVAHAFWQAFRNGILHQTTFSRTPIKVFGGEALPVFCAFGRRTCVPIVTLHSTRTFILDPYAFAEAVVSIVEKDFSVYKAAEPKHHRLTITIGSTTFAL
jgi:hypothetical protein